MKIIVHENFVIYGIQSLADSGTTISQGEKHNQRSTGESRCSADNAGGY